MPSILAPMAIRQLARSAISGSRAAFGEDGGAFGERGGHQQVFGGADRDEGEDDVGAVQAGGGGGVDIAGVELDGGTHGFQPFEVQVDRAGADIAAAGQRDAGFAAAGQQRADDQEGGAHFADDVVGRLGIGDAAAEREGAALRLDGDAVLGEQLRHGPQIGQFGDVGEHQAVIGEEAAGHQREGGVFGAGDGDAAR